MKKRSYLTTPFGLIVNRARVLGIIIEIKIFRQDQTEGNMEGTKKDYCYLVVDDGTETIRIKVWGDDINKYKLPDLKIGDDVDIIGKIRNFNDEIYIMPEIIRKISDPNLELLRELEKIELKKLFKNKKIVNTISAPSSEDNNNIDNKVEPE